MSEQLSASDTSATLRWGAGQRVDDRERGAARILTAARRCIADSSVASATIDEIAREAGVSRRTVYRYFDSKDAIVRALVEEQAETFFEHLRESLQSLSAGGFRRALIHCVLFTVEKGPQMAGYQLLLGRTNAAATADFYLRSTKLNKKMVTLLRDRFEQAQKGGEVDPQWSLVDLLNWTGRLVYSFIQFQETPETIERMVEQYLLPRPTQPR